MQALDLTGAYTSAEVVAALTAQSGTRLLTFRHDRLDSSNKYLGPVQSMTAAEVSNASLASIKRTAKFTLLDSEGINYGSDRIRPWARLAMPKAPSTYVAGPVARTNLCTNPSPANSTGYSMTFGGTGSGSVTFGAVANFPSINAGMEPLCGSLWGHCWRLLLHRLCLWFPYLGGWERSPNDAIF